MKSDIKEEVPALKKPFLAKESSIPLLPQDKYMIGELCGSHEKDINKLMGALVLPLKHQKSN